MMTMQPPNAIHQSYCYKARNERLMNEHMQCTEATVMRDNCKNPQKPKLLLKPPKTKNCNFSCNQFSPGDHMRGWSWES